MVLTCEIEEQMEDRPILCDYTWLTENEREIQRVVHPCTEPAKLPETEWDEKDTFMGQNV